MGLEHILKVYQSVQATNLKTSFLEPNAQSINDGAIVDVGLVRSQSLYIKKCTHWFEECLYSLDKFDRNVNIGPAYNRHLCSSIRIIS